MRIFYIQKHDETVRLGDQLTLIKVNKVLPFLAVSSAAISRTLYYVCTFPNVVTDGEALEAALTVPH